ncbi:OmpA family protein [Hymenobacter sp. RP-2-7]|uniref:OmpA family protein n=1 Tax=Hymenobacter polaris TaxID=2682546 RepID=A0A7Y0ADE1_9BACT|nr:PA14 domain-containing protein [Hymenobacter polaris]NML65272.1 OmpA family protein [Hymenobacter polaris]
MLPTGVGAQVPVGNGLQGAYYQGANFDQFVTTRRDAVINFDWHARRPVAGVGAEQFSVRWTGWLVPPTTGRYVLHLSADDGLRLWLDERPLLDDWRGQGLSYHQVAVDLRAGQAYALRLDYCQATAATRVRLAWELPAAPATSRPRHTRGSFAMASSEVVVVPTRYLFSDAPTLPPAPVAAVVEAAPAIPLPPPARPPAAPTSVLVLHPSTEAASKPRPRSYLALGANQPLTPSPPAATSSNRVTTVAARLAAGQAVTLRTLYFEQGQAGLLPAARASLDTLAQALVGQPTLHLQVQGHTDNQGDPAINQQLSQRRAEAVCRYLQAHGIAPYRLQALGLGGTQPVADNTIPAERPRNRRVVLRPLP